MATVESRDTRALDHRFERIGWGLFLITIGGLALIPSVPGGAWLIGTGLIMLGLNVARYFNGIRTSSFTIVLGSAAIILGLAGVIGTDLPWFPILLIVIGASLLWRTFMERQRTS